MAKECALSTGKLSLRVLPRNSAVRITDRPDTPCSNQTKQTNGTDKFMLGGRLYPCNMDISDYKKNPNVYIVPMEFRVYVFPRISVFSRRTEMHLNGMLLIGTEFFKIIVPL